MMSPKMVAIATSLLSLFLLIPIVVLRLKSTQEDHYPSTDVYNHSQRDNKPWTFICNKCAIILVVSNVTSANVTCKADRNTEVITQIDVGHGLPTLQFPPGNYLLTKGNGRLLYRNLRQEERDVITKSWPRHQVSKLNKRQEELKFQIDWFVSRKELLPYQAELQPFFLSIYESDWTHKIPCVILVRNVHRVNVTERCPLNALPNATLSVSVRFGGQEKDDTFIAYSPGYYELVRQGNETMVSTWTKDTLEDVRQRIADVGQDEQIEKFDAMVYRLQKIGVPPPVSLVHWTRN